MEERAIRAAADLMKAEAAKSLLSNPVVIEVFTALESRYMDEWRNSEPHQEEAREKSYFRLQALDALRQDIQSIIDGGRFAENTLRRQR